MLKKAIIVIAMLFVGVVLRGIADNDPTLAWCLGVGYGCALIVALDDLAKRS